MNKLEMAKKLQAGTKAFALAIIRLSRKLPNNRESNVISYQIIKSGTSVAANYRAACRSRSKKEFVAKIGVVVEEADETVFWPEGEEILAIVAKSEQTATKPLNR